MGQYVIYSRKSRFTGRGESVENQVELCRRYIANQFGEAAAESTQVYEDEGFSGSNLDRPRFQQMMKDAERSPFDAIVVYRLDRISRNIGDFAGLIQKLGERGIGFISIREQFDTASPMGRAMMYIASVFSQLERETIAERIRDNMHELAKTGRWLGGATPTGYISEGAEQVSLDGRTRRVCHLKQIPGEIGLVKQIYDLFLETGSLTQVDRYLLEHRIRTRQGKEFSRFSIRAILTNPVYMIADREAYSYLAERRAELSAPESAFDGTHGVMAYNRTLQRPGKTNRLNPMSQWIVAVGGHEGIIPGAVWASIQKKLEQNRTQSVRRPRSNTALLSGLLICGSCGGPMRPKATGRTASNGQPGYVYLCSRKERSCGTVCRVKNPNGNELDAAVLSILSGLREDRPWASRRLKQLSRTMNHSGEDQTTETALLRGRLEETEESIRALVASLTHAAGTGAQSYIVDQIDVLHHSRKELCARLQTLEETAQPKSLPPDQEAALIRQLSSLPRFITRVSPEEQRTALRTCIRQIIWTGTRAEVVFLKESEQGK